MSIVIPYLFRDIAEKVNVELFSRAEDPFNVYFDFGHYVNVTRNLTMKDGSISHKNKKYPLIWLVMDFVESFKFDEYGYCELPDLQILIAMATQPTLTDSERYEKSFIPRLLPIYEELKNQMELSGYFELSGPFFTHEKIDRPYWGGQDTNGNGQANLFNDFIDAVQLRKIKLKVNEEACEKFNIYSS